ncbi:adp-ribosylation factor-like protein 2-binding [Plasmopara halstedii]|uniref:ADP-ribosylation factor-like protein 2-binding protein n=1 Tax=Plasmopara halstedii TaxID=4781 RepID=A0A0P1AZA0_PLAHL|nr:adp-ribosylation factor-like protein 2-binding [Plasmopara halstedii]CEG46257.1 adp-ribosylation factor-like protein 2-binding [Plasmopara halstedii]|eukprot:XP_024582626.1 adp-ribosylation factor-like protein 2-binding [Plasmopara halstedii]
MAEVESLDDGEEVYDDDVGEENAEDTKFDKTIGILQDILLDPKFVDMQVEFCRNNCEIFDDVSENKLVYMDIFRQYTDLIETFIDDRLSETLEHFSMEEFCSQIQEHEEEIPLDVIDVLLSSSCFEEFKSLMLSFKQNEAPCIEITGDALVCCGQ